MDPERFDEDLDPTFNFDADPDPYFNLLQYKFKKTKSTPILDLFSLKFKDLKLKGPF